jgi:hypothetical protein
MFEFHFRASDAEKFSDFSQNPDGKRHWSGKRFNRQAAKSAKIRREGRRQRPEDRGQKCKKGKGSPS